MPAERPAPLADLVFSGRLVEWRGPAPFFFVAVPARLVGELRHAAHIASYGWGVVPVEASADGVAFRTSLFPRDGGYLVPVKAEVRRAAAIGPEAPVRIRLIVRPPTTGR